MPANSSIHTQGFNASKQLIFALTPNRTSQTLSVAEVTAAGFLSGVPTSLVTAPVERAKVLLQVHRAICVGLRIDQRF